MKAETLVALQVARAEKKLTVLLTDLEGGAEALIVNGAAIRGNSKVSKELLDAAREASLQDACRTVEVSGRRWFIRVFNPPRRLFIVGAVHIAQSLSAMAREAGYAVTLVDPRDSWATAERFPDVEIDRRWPAEALREHDIDRRSAIVALSHDAKLDEPALASALRSDAFYIGALGSRRTHASRIERLREYGFDDERLAAIHGPIGLDIGAVSPAEIAVAILAEMTQQLRAPGVQH